MIVHHRTPHNLTSRIGLAKSKAGILRHCSSTVRSMLTAVNHRRVHRSRVQRLVGCFLIIACRYEQALTDHYSPHSERKFAAVEAACQKMHKDSVVFRDSVSSELFMFPFPIMTCMVNTTF